jgi:hypothetical protein
MSTATEELLGIERASWEALATAGAAAPMYDELLAGQVLMLLPGGLVIDDRDAVIDSMRGAPWDRYELADERVTMLTDDAAVVAYRGTAQRGDQDYEALFSSTYVRERGAWHLAVHQQTPV